jgi:hypothetical protein
VGRRCRRPQDSLARAGVIVVALKLAWPYTIVRALDGTCETALAVPPLSLLVKEGPGFITRLIRTIRVDPVVARMVKDDVEQYADAALVSFRH